ncbi:aminotransferase class IV [Pontibacter burrus]|uniref:branched-chain-amino-acid transaminase n=1 Tax=Pontibacter burrus TaxID=2704466 RepID=A0A6B3LNY9_9BACT|nr:aminotransferase class IV [Pontibacter burrus]NEM98622.1 amino acid aminotransferase [Pontibacter burrus]
MQTLQAYIHDCLQPYNQATLHISDLSIQRGYGIFDFFKVQQGQPMFLDDYLKRFYESARQMELPVPLDTTELKEVIRQLIQANQLPLSGIKMILTGGYSESGYDIGKPNLIITEQPLTLPDQTIVTNGLKVITHSHVRELPEVKTINYTMGIRLLSNIKAAGAADMLYQQNGIVSEFPRCNFFIVTRDDVVVTPDKNVLSGITRKNVLQLARQKYKTEERAVTIADIAQAKEAFLTSTTKRILPIVQVDDLVIGNGKPGEITNELLADLIALEQTQL